MFNLFDIMRSAQGGAGFDALARQFGLGTDQARRAVEALLPAFTLGFQRSAGDPNALAQLFAMMGAGRQVPYFDNPMLAFSAQAMAQGNEIVGQLFGSPDVARRVAEHTARTTGVAAETLSEMLPAIAAILIGGMEKMVAVQGLGGLFGPLADMMRAGLNVPKPEPASAPNPMELWGQMMGAMIRNATPPPPSPQPAPEPSKTPENPWEALMRGFLQAQGAAGPEAAPSRNKAAERPDEPSEELAPPAAVWSRMVQTGIDVQEQQFAALRGIFEAYAPKRDGG